MTPTQTHPPASSSDGVWRGQVSGQKVSDVTLVNQDGSVAGTVNTDASVFSVVIHPNGTGYTTQRAWKDVPREKRVVPPANKPAAPKSSPPAPLSSSDGGRVADDNNNNIDLQQLPTSNFIESDSVTSDGGNRRRRRDDGSEFTVLFAYTKRACCQIAFQLDTCDVNTCRAAVQAKMSLTAAEVNTGFTNAQITPRIRTVGSYLVSAYDDVTGDPHLDRLQALDDGYMDEVPVLRNLYSADLVHLIVGLETDYCGIGYVGANVAVSASYAFSVSSSDCFTGTFTVGHEFGHK